MLAALRMIANVLLALGLLAFTLLALGTGLGVVVADAWEVNDLTRGVEENTWAWLDGEPVHYRVLGPEEGAPVVLLHGRYVEGGFTWRETARSLSGMGLRVVVIDMPGFGHSTRSPDSDFTLAGQAMAVSRLLNELRLREATIVGHGWGGAVALEVARLQPQFVARLALISPVVHASPAPGWAPLARLPYVGRAAAWAIDAGGPLWRAQQRRAYGDPGSLTEAYRQGVLVRGRMYGTIEALEAMVPALDNAELVAALGEIRQPTLVICGAEDRIVGRRQYERLVEALPDASLEVVPGAGHMVHLEREAEAIRLLARLLYASGE